MARTRCRFDLGAALGRYRTESVGPLVDRAGCDTDLASELHLAVLLKVGFKVHPHNIAWLLSFCKSRAKKNFYSAATLQS